MTLPRLALLTLPFLLAACDGGGDPVQQALLETSSKNHAATVVEGEVSGPQDHAGHGAMAGNAAFAESEAEMHRLMTAASGETVDQAYVAKMIAHHQGAVAMAEVALAESTDPEIRRMAQAVIEAQTREIAEMRAWSPSNGT
ncbi:DUF305 domain-containing protein [Brevundimonas sp. LM2]|uniref:DUF305 domain-containing protein n=1 Tax=Brevundimonas sp. LM2 TaxID=1938605 RepID=UPI00098391A9|nr:DUF305 domain-containing protein [Brevundimonas sp. LM2]AQR62613.1 DUF305 domain-containing protein [Brevundimonas sp. LM2]